MNSDFFKGRIVWITGASSGIGEALVLNLAVRGAIIIASSRNREELENVKTRCGHNAPNVNIVPLDLANTGNIEDIVSEQINRFGKIDILVNVAGISQRSRIEDTPLWLDRKIFEINYFGTIALSKAVLPYMIQRKSGYILATSSISGRFGFPLRSAYSASKQALHGFMETLHLENKANNISASVIIPGRVRTAISIHALEGDGKEHGRLDEGQEKGISPVAAAEIIVKGILKGKREIMVGGSELLLLYIRRFAPALFFRIADKIKST